MSVLKHLFVFCLVFVWSKNSFSAASNTLMVSDALQSNMVLQRNKAFKVWGKANPDEQVFISGDWMAAPITVVTAVGGIFAGSIDIPAAAKGDFTAHQIQIREKKILTNLLIGDVWFCSGQSNMQFAVKEMAGAEEVIKAADQPHIRLLNVGLNFRDTPIDHFSGSWQACSAQTVKGFSAVGYTLFENVIIEST